jgi:hypothetical protein
MDLERVVIRTERKLDQVIESLASMQPQAAGVDFGPQLAAILEKLATIEADVAELKAKKKP